MRLPLPSRIPRRRASTALVVVRVRRLDDPDVGHARAAKTRGERHARIASADNDDLMYHCTH